MRLIALEESIISFGKTRNDPRMARACENIAPHNPHDVIGADGAHFCPGRGPGEKAARTDRTARHIEIMRYKSEVDAMQTLMIKQIKSIVLVDTPITVVREGDGEGGEVESKPTIRSWMSVDLLNGS